MFWSLLKSHRQDQIVAALQASANAGDAEAQSQAAAVVDQFPSLSPQERGKLAAYLRQIPAVTRQSLKRRSKNQTCDRCSRTLRDNICHRRARLDSPGNQDLSTRLL